MLTVEAHRVAGYGVCESHFSTQRLAAHFVLAKLIDNVYKQNKELIHAVGEEVTLLSQLQTMA